GAMPAVADAASAIVPQNALQVELKKSRDDVAHLRDYGQPGDQYEVKLCIAGKYRAVTWSKID
ncbi:unnamed protein product, partial [Effrenium voratum]